MVKDIEQLYLKQDEPNKSCLLALRDIILALSPDISESIKYGMPFFSYKGKMFCYFWMDKKTTEPYVGVMNGSLLDQQKLEQGNRSLIKIFRINPKQDIPVKELKRVLELSMTLYK